MVRVGWGGETTEKRMGGRGGPLFAWPVGIGLIIDSPEPPPPCCKLHPVSTPRLTPCACWPLGITANSWYTDTLATEMTPHLANFEFCNHRFLFFLTLIIHNFCLYLSLHSPRHVLNPNPPPPHPPSCVRFHVSNPLLFRLSVSLQANYGDWHHVVGMGIYHP